MIDILESHQLCIVLATNYLFYTLEILPNGLIELFAPNKIAILYGIQPFIFIGLTVLVHFYANIVFYNSDETLSRVCKEK